MFKKISKQDIKKSWDSGLKDAFIKEINESKVKKKILNLLVSSLTEYSYIVSDILTVELRKDSYKKLNNITKEKYIAELFGLDDEKKSKDELFINFLQEMSETKSSIEDILSGIKPEKNLEEIKLNSEELISIWSGKWHKEFERLFLDNSENFLESIGSSALSIKGTNKKLDIILEKFYISGFFKKEGFYQKISLLLNKTQNRIIFIKNIYKNVSDKSRLQEVIFRIQEIETMKKENYINNMYSTV